MLMNMFSDLILENLEILIDFIYICNKQTGILKMKIKSK